MKDLFCINISNLPVLLEVMSYEILKTDTLISEKELFSSPNIVEALSMGFKNLTLEVKVSEIQKKVNKIKIKMKEGNTIESGEMAYAYSSQIQSYRILNKELEVFTFYKEEEKYSPMITRKLFVQFHTLDNDEYSFLEPFYKKIIDFKNVNLYDDLISMKNAIADFYSSKKRKAKPVNSYLEFICFKNE